MVLHGVADDVGDLDEPAIVLVVQRPEDAALVSASVICCL